MKFVALLRGINVGGNNLIKMSELREAFQQAGFSDVVTYINSGNVIFTSDETDSTKLTDKLERMLTKIFSYHARVVVRSLPEIEKTLADVPDEWNTDAAIRCYVGFLTEYVKEEDIAEIPVREGVDKLKISQGVLYMTTDIKQLTKSGFNKMMAKKIYKEMTIRNITTVRKLLLLMQQ